MNSDEIINEYVLKDADEIVITGKLLRDFKQTIQLETAKEIFKEIDEFAEFDFIMYDDLETGERKTTILYEDVLELKKKHCGDKE